MPENRLKIFISYAHEDIDKVRSISNILKENGFLPWIADENLLPGEKWRVAIQRAIRDSDIILVCLSNSSVSKKGYIQRELKIAFDVWDEKPDNAIFLIPILLEHCEVPDMLRDLQWVDFTKKSGVKSLLMALHFASDRFDKKINKIESEYILNNIYDLLIGTFTVNELRKISYDTKALRSVFNEVSNSASTKAEIVHTIVDYAINTQNLDKLIDSIQKINPEAYKKYQPYYKSESIQKISVEKRPLENPYIVGNPIQLQPSNMKVFLGRFDTANSIINEMKKGSQKPSILLYGRRRMGKSSALLNISNLINDPDFIHIYISGQSAKYHTNIDFCYYLVNEIYERFTSSSLNIDDFVDNTFLDRNYYLKKPVIILSEFFKKLQILLDFHRLYCLLSIDEYEELDMHINNHDNDHEQYISRELLLELRDTLQHRTRIIFLFAGTHYLRDLSNVNWSEIFINVKTLHISFLSKEDGFQLLTKPVPRLQYQNEDLINYILELTGCQPYFLQAIASEIVNILNYQLKEIVTNEILDQAVINVIVMYNTHFDYIWDTECETEKHKELIKIVSSSILELTDNQLNSYQDELRDLIRKEVLKVNEGKIELTMPIVKLWMKKNQCIL